MIVLVGFEESQAITIEFRKLGHEAFSCDLQECSGNHPEWHLKMDIFEAIKLRKWDLIILHPPCTYTAVSGNRWYWNSTLRVDIVTVRENKIWKMPPSKERSKLRSKTYPGIAAAIANQYSKQIIKTTLF